MSHTARFFRLAVLSILGAILVIAYYFGAMEHGRRMNTSWARADQSGYIMDAVHVYENWHGTGPTC